MATQVQNRRGSTTEHASFTGAVGEITVDTTKKTVVVHDGTTAGGAPLMRENGAQALVTTGTSTAASFIPTSSTAPTAGLYAPGGGLAISTNGTGRLFVDASGNVAVGTSATTFYSGRFTIQGGALALATGNKAIFWSPADNGSGEIVSPAQNVLAFNTNTTERMRLDSSGRLGLGTSSAVAPLTVVAASNNTDIAVFSGSAGTSRGLKLSTSVNFNSDALVIYDAQEATYGAHLFRTRGTNALFIDQSQRVGIGTTSPSRPLHVSSSGSEQVILSSTSGSLAGIFFEPNGTTYTPFFGATGNSLVSYTQGLERARIDSSGRLLVGTSTARANVYYTTVATTPSVQFESVGSVYNGLSLINYSASGYSPVLTLGLSASNAQGTNTAVSSTFELGAINFAGSDGTDFRTGASIVATNDQLSAWAVGDCPTRLVFSTTADGASSPTERMRITQEGYARFNTTGDPSTAGNIGAQIGFNSQNFWRSRNSGTGSYGHMAFYNDNGEVGGITTSGSSTAFSTSSDYRLKENVVLLTGAIDRLQQIPVHRFNFIADPNRTVDGFIAHEAQAVVPECVTGTKDEVDADGNPVYQGIDQSKLVPLLTAALQEALAEIETLKARVTALEP